LQYTLLEHFLEQISLHKTVVISLWSRDLCRISVTETRRRWWWPLSLV